MSKSTRLEELKKLSYEGTASDEHGILAKLWRKILLENKLINQLLFNINRYERTPGPKKKNKSVIIKSVIDPRISFKTFLFLLFEILRVKKVKLRVEIDFGMKTSVHEIEITADDYKKGTAEEEENDEKNNKK